MKVRRAIVRRLTAKGPFHYEDMIRVPMVVSLPGKVPANRVSDALQSLLDYPQTFLSLCGIETEQPMTGVDQSRVWLGERDCERSHVIVENHHQGKRIHIKTYVDARYKLTVYLNQPDGELFDLENDPGEISNLWYLRSHLPLKDRLLEKLLRAEFEKEEPLTADLELLPQKSAAMYLKSLDYGGYTVAFDAATESFSLRRIASGSEENLWCDPAYQRIRTEMIRQLLFARMDNEPMWMPRISGA